MFQKNIFKFCFQLRSYCIAFPIKVFPIFSFIQLEFSFYPIFIPKRQYWKLNQIFTIGLFASQFYVFLNVFFVYPKRCLNKIIKTLLYLHIRTRTILPQPQSVSNVWQIYYFKYLTDRDIHEFKSNIRAACIGLQIGVSITRLSTWFWYT